MTVTLRLIGVNLGIGIGVMTGSFLVFGMIVKSGKINDVIAPRTWARSDKVIKNVLRYPYCLSWFTWSIHLSYQDMLKGIPGTGTRKGGEMGKFLRCNLDGLVLVRMHVLCFKIALLATLGCMGLILPMNLTVTCGAAKQVTNTCTQLRNLTDYEKTTLANVPSLETAATESLDASGIVARLYATVLFAYLLYIYTASLLWREWIDLLALRRVFHMEYDHWQDRRNEKESLDLLHEPCDVSPQDIPSFIPHPELRVTVPNVALWSVLYRLPDDLSQQQNNASKDWQLYLTTQFFDQCIPNQPGFSSSVAAVTILPNANELSAAWSIWYKAARRIRRLRYIRQRMSKLRERSGSSQDESLYFTAHEESTATSGNASDTANANANANASHSISSFEPLSSSARSKMSAIMESDAEHDGTEHNSSAFESCHMPDAASAGAAVPHGNSDDGAEEGKSSPPRFGADGADQPSEAVSEQAVLPQQTDPGQMRNQRTESFLDIGNFEDAESTYSGENGEECDTGDIEQQGGMEGGPADIGQSGSSSSATTTAAEAARQQGHRSAPSKNEQASQHNGNDKDKGKSWGMAPIQESEVEDGNARVGDVDNGASDDDHHSPCAADDDGDNYDDEEVSSFLDSLSQPKFPASRPDSAERDFVKTKGSRKSSMTLQDIFQHDYPGKDPRAEAFKHTDDNGDDEDFYCMYQMSEDERREFAREVGFDEDWYFDRFLKSYGPEQTSTYAVEFARSGGGCCMRGCCEEMVRMADMERLIEMEEDAKEVLEAANERLLKARSRVKEATLDAKLDDLNAKSVHETRAMVLLHGASVATMSSTKPALRVSSLRRRESIVMTQAAEAEDNWTKAQLLTQPVQSGKRRKKKPQYRFLDTGELRVPLTKNWRARFQEINEKVLTSAASTSKDLVDIAIKTNTYAVVTFTSRQAALAARQCTMDGNAMGMWRQVEDIPVPPLADAAPYNFWHRRNFCQPVTLTINNRQKFTRKLISYVLLFLMYFLYTIPLAAASSLLSTENLTELFPKLHRMQGNTNADSISGFLTGVLYTLFFSICPHIFKAIANFGSGATSVRAAEVVALKYYWYFSLMTAFTGTSLATMVLEGLGSEITIGREFQTVLRNVAAIIPTQVSATWLNWMIVRLCHVYPLFYLLQIGALVASSVRFKWLARVMRGGGAGMPVPFRLYVDTGVVFLCVISLSPVSPLVAPIALAYMIIASPLIRWLLIFVYRPNYDSGGNRWPLIFEIFISAMILSQIFMTTMMLLKQAYGPGLLASLSIMPTYWFSQHAYDRFLRYYQDAGLLQTSQLDGWGSSALDSVKKREEYRKWLVDCHKASYVPVCLAGADNFLTAEPAAVIPLPTDSDSKVRFNDAQTESDESTPLQPTNLRASQRGATFRRVRSISSMSRSSLV